MNDPHELVARMQRGDDTAFEELFKAYSEQLLHFARSFVADRDMAEDLVQDVWSWLWTRRREWSPPRNVFAYLAGAVRNQALFRARTERSRRSASSLHAEHEGSPGMGTSVTPADIAVEARDRASYLWRVVATLPEPRRTVLLLRWVHGLDWETIAQTLSISVAAAKMQHTSLECAPRAAPDVFK